MWRRILIITSVLAAVTGTWWLIQLDTIAAAPKGAADTCKGVPPFLSKYGMTQPEFDSSRRDKPGLVLSDSTQPSREVVQEKSWKQFGSLGPITRDEKGTVYTASIPVINTLSMPKDSHLDILKVDPNTGELNRWFELKGSGPNNVNYYGITALTYDCATRLLYIAAVAGSTKDKENGFIAVVDPLKKEEKFRYEGVDGLGLGIFGGKDGRYIYIGSARDSSIVRVKLTKAGKPFGEREEVIQFDDFNRTRARKLVFNNMGLNISTTEFYFNLIASTEFDQQHITYQYNQTQDIFVRANAN